jgi:hypothetical protein
MADEAPVRTLEEFEAIAGEHGGILGFCRAGDFWDVYVVHVEVLRDRPPYRCVVCIDVGGTIHLVPEERFREIFEASRFFRVDGIEEALRAVERGALSATVSQYPYAIGSLGVDACLAAAAGKSLPAKIDAPIQVITPQNVARAEARFPQPIEPFESPFAALLRG